MWKSLFMIAAIGLLPGCASYDYGAATRNEEYCRQERENMRRQAAMGAPEGLRTEVSAGCLIQAP